MDGFIGQVMVFAGTFAPRNWAFCHGQTYSIANNQAFYSIIGTIYGGDGRTSFKLPDLRGGSPVGAGTRPGLQNVPLGQTAGIDFYRLSVSHLPSHTHSAGFNGTPSATVTPGAFSGRATLTNEVTGNYPAQTASGTDIYATSANTQMGASPVTVSLSGVTINVSHTGGGQDIDNRSPYVGMNWVICSQGVYPSRN